ncbi:hypothetical protein BDQ17DRAFT_1332080 [Cyathus striatus]|nr:hypothetical protein BDQ17DRAFT_1332080 [Cyathus striatus]
MPTSSRDIRTDARDDQIDLVEDTRALVLRTTCVYDLCNTNSIIVGIYASLTSECTSECLTNVIDQIRRHGNTYFEAIDMSLKTAQDGIAFADNAKYLLSFIRNGEDKLEIIQFIENLQTLAGNAHKSANAMSDGFRVVELGFSHLKKDIDIVAKDIAIKLASFKNSKKNFEIWGNIFKVVSTGLRLLKKNVKKRLKLESACKNISSILENTYNVSRWWCSMEMQLETIKVIVENSPSVSTIDGRILDNLDQMWKQVRISYNGYVNVVSNIQDMYPKIANIGKKTFPNNLLALVDFAVECRKSVAGIQDAANVTIKDKHIRSVHDPLDRIREALKLETKQLIAILKHIYFMVKIDIIRKEGRDTSFSLLTPLLEQHMDTMQTINSCENSIIHTFGTKKSWRKTRELRKMQKYSVEDERNSMAHLRSFEVEQNDANVTRHKPSEVADPGKCFMTLHEALNHVPHFHDHVITVVHQHYDAGIHIASMIHTSVLDTIIATLEALNTHV